MRGTMCFSLFAPRPGRRLLVSGCDGSTGAENGQWARIRRARDTQQRSGLVAKLQLFRFALFFEAFWKEQRRNEFHSRFQEPMAEKREPRLRTNGRHSGRH